MPSEPGAGIVKNEPLSITQLASDAYLLKPQASQTGTLASGISQTWTTDGTTVGFQVSNSGGTFAATFKTGSLTYDTGTSTTFKLNGKVLNPSATPALNDVLLYNGTKYVNSPATGLPGTLIGITQTASPYYTALGYDSMGITTVGGSPPASTGAYNTAVGYATLLGNTSGAYNSAFGIQALQTNTTGSYNSAFGPSALYFNVSGNYNSAFGYQALYENTGDYNSAFGYYALQANTSGIHNCAFGYNALASTTSGSSSCAFGFQALFSATTGASNTAFGYQTLTVCTTGSSNVAIGLSALDTLTTGSNNTAVGTSAGASMTLNGGGVFIGYQAGTSETSANRLYISNSSSATPLIKGTFGGNAAVAIQFGDETNAYYVWNSQTATDATINHTFSVGSAISYAAAANSSHSLLGLSAYTLTFTGTTTTTAMNGLMLNIAQPTLTDTSAQTTTTASTLYIAGAPIAGGSVTITNAYALHVASGLTNLAGNLNTPNIVSVTAATTGTGWALSSSTLTTGSLATFTSTSTALSGVVNLNSITISGANAAASVTATGLSISVTNTNATSGTNRALYLSATGATTANQALYIDNGGTATFAGATSGTFAQSAAATTTSYSVIWPSAIGSATQTLSISSISGTIATLGWAASSPTWHSITDPSATSFNAGTAAAGGMGTTFLAAALANALLFQSPTATSLNTQYDSPMLTLQGSTWDTVSSAAYTQAVQMYYEDYGSGKFPNSVFRIQTLDQSGTIVMLVLDGPAGNHNVGVGGNTFNPVNYIGNSSAQYNTAVGHLSLNGLATGANNTAIGNNCMGNHVISGTVNTGLGDSALENLTSGSKNIGIGSKSLDSISTTSYNIGIGDQVGLSLTGSQNVVIGHIADALPAATSNALNITNFLFGAGLTGTSTTVAGTGIGIGVLPANITAVLQTSGANTASAVIFGDGTGGTAGNTYYLLNTQTATDAVINHTFSVGSAISYAAAANSSHSLLGLSAYTLTLTGTTAVTALNGLLANIQSPIVTDTSAETVTTASTLYIQGAPIAAGSVTITNAYALHVASGLTNLAGNLNTPNIVSVTAATTGTGWALSSSTLTTGSLATFTSTSTALSGTVNLNSITISGANAAASVTATGLLVSVTNTGTTNTNVALTLTASGASTINTALNITAGRILSGAAQTWALPATTGSALNITDGTSSYLLTTTGVLGTGFVQVNTVGLQIGGVAGTGATANQIYTASQGAATTTLYIGNASITVTSDSRIKNIIGLSNRSATDIFSNLQVVDFTWADPSDTAPVNKNSRGVWTGITAQQAIDYVPWLVNAEDRNCTVCRMGGQCAVHESMWNVDWSHEFGIVVKGFQETYQRFETLEQRVERLEAENHSLRSIIEMERMNHDHGK